MTLHEAIIEVLSDNRQGLTASQIAEKVNQRKTYIRGDGEPLPSSQISARVNKYPDLFSKRNGLIYPKDKSSVAFSDKGSGPSVTIYSIPEEITNILISFGQNCFDPSNDVDSKIVDKAGNYIICLRQGSKLPLVSIEPVFTKFQELDVIYTGIAGSSLRNRDYRQHFIGDNAGRSTLRKSLGVLFGFKQIPRDSDPKTGKTKFGEDDEATLSEWMKKNLIMYYLPTKDHERQEKTLINHFNPPLNLKDNHNLINTDFRRLLSSLRG